MPRVNLREAFPSRAEAARIVALEDDPSVRKLLGRVLGQDHDIRFARDGAHLLSLVDLGLVQFVILDLMLPDESGLDIGRRLHARSDVPIIILSALSDPERIVEGLAAFADDYVTKPFVPDVLRSRVASLLRRCAQRIRDSAGPGMFDIEIGTCRIAHQDRALTAGGQAPVHLTEREYQILVRLSRSAGGVVTRDELSQAVCGRNWHPFDRTLDVHVCNLRTKLGRILPGMRLIRAARGSGYFLDCIPRFVEPGEGQAAGGPENALAQ